MADGPSSADELRAYFGAVASALGALERRLVARDNLTGQEALEEIRRYRAVVREDLLAIERLRETRPTEPKDDAPSERG